MAFARARLIRALGARFLGNNRVAICKISDRIRAHQQQWIMGAMPTSKTKEQRMKKTLTLSLMLFLFIPSLTFAQNSRSTRAQADKAWPIFWSQFSTAIKRKDRVALKRLMASESEFFSGGGGETRDEWITMTGWKKLQTIPAIGTMPYNELQNPARITKDRGLVFEYIRGRWGFTGVMGD